jgi:hypothetical protein
METPLMQDERRERDDSGHGRDGSDRREEVDRQ